MIQKTFRNLNFALSHFLSLSLPLKSILDKISLYTKRCKSDVVINEGMRAAPSRFIIKPELILRIKKYIFESFPSRQKKLHQRQKTTTT